MSLPERKCQACEGFKAALTHAEAADFMPQIPGWTLDPTGLSISRHFEFKGFPKVMMFVNAVAFIAQSEGHHPDLRLGYHYCDITFTTHALNGLSDNDFICAAKINTLL